MPIYKHSHCMCAFMSKSVRIKFINGFTYTIAEALASPLSFHLTHRKHLVVSATTLSEPGFFYFFIIIIETSQKHQGISLRVVVL